MTPISLVRPLPRQPPESARAARMVPAVSTSWRNFGHSICDGASIANVALPAAFDAPFARMQAVVVAYLAALTVSVLGALAPGLWPLVAGAMIAAALLAARYPRPGQA